MLTLDEPKDFEFIIVLFVKSSYSTLYEVDMPGVKDIDIESFCNRLWFSLQITVPTIFSTKPVISCFCDVKLCFTPTPSLIKKSW